MTDPQRLSALRQIAAETLARCTVTRRASFFGAPAAVRVVIPAGDGKYPSFWVRDCAMMAESGLLDPAVLRDALRIILRCGVNGAAEKKLAHGLRLPPFCVADHVNYDGRPVFFPGTYDSGADQGDGRYGTLPPLGDGYFFISLFSDYVKQTGDVSLLTDETADLLYKIWDGYCVDPATDLCACDLENRAVDWGFCDSIVKSGKLLFPSLLRLKAARELGRLSGKPDWDARADRIAAAVRATFPETETGWLLSATETGRQPDVWGTAFAVCLGVLDERQTTAACAALLAGFTSGDTVRDGAVRHVPLSRDFSPASAWDSAPGVARGNYQNGAWWPTATGWYARALNARYPDAARRLLDDFIAHTLQNRAGGAPWEFVRADNGETSGADYGTSAALNFSQFSHML